MNLFSKYLIRIGVSVDRPASDSIVSDALKKYADSKQLLEIDGGWFRLTKKGIDECKESNRDWDE
jgi:hypothetical protein